MEKENVFNDLKAIGQEHLLRFYDELDEQGKEKLTEQLCEIDYSVLDISDNEQQRGSFEPLGAETIDKIALSRELYTEKGL